jgi:hypothetical protein
MFISKN